MGQEQDRDDVEQFRFAQSTGYLLARAGAESRRRWAAMLVAHDLTPYDYGVLLAVNELGSVGQGTLAESLGVDRRNMVAVVDRLSERGLVQRRTSTEDRRRRSIVLTPAGRTLARRVVEDGARLEGELLGHLSEADLARLRRMLESVLDIDR